MAKKSGAKVLAIKNALDGMININPEIRYKNCFTSSKFTTGVIAFRPASKADPKQIKHGDKDVVCQVLKGRGRLRLKDRKIPLRAGMLCHIPKGIPHDFAAGKSGELVLVYSLIHTG